jgi:hypothetical protein
VARVHSPTARRPGRGARRTEAAAWLAGAVGSKRGEGEVEPRPPQGCGRCGAAVLQLRMHRSAPAASRGGILHRKMMEDVKHGGGEANGKKKGRRRGLPASHQWEQRRGEFLRWLPKGFGSYSSGVEVGLKEGGGSSTRGTEQRWQAAGGDMMLVRCSVEKQGLTGGLTHCNSTTFNLFK